MTNQSVFVFNLYKLQSCPPNLLKLAII